MASWRWMLACGGIAVIAGGIGGLGLAEYARSDAFDFYRQAPPAPAAPAASAPRGSWYPASRPTPVAAAWPEAIAPPHVAIARPARPADYRRAATLEAEDPPPPEESLPAGNPAPMIAPQRGSWSEPADDAPPPETPATDIAS